MENICRFCLDMIKDHNFEEVKDFTKEIIDVLLLNIDFNISLSPIICGTCSKKLKYFFDFKCTCLYTEDAIAPFAHSQKKSYVNLHDVYIEQKANEGLACIPDDQKICRLCMEFTSDNFKTLNETENDVIILRDIIKQYFPEVNLTVTEDPTICIACFESLKKCSCFINTCLEVEEIIEKYRKSNIANIYIESSIKLSNIVQFRSEEEQNKKIITEEDNETENKDTTHEESKDSMEEMPDGDTETGCEVLPEDCGESNQKSRENNGTEAKKSTINPPLKHKKLPKQATPMCSCCLYDDNKFVTLQIDSQSNVTIRGCEYCVVETKTGGLQRAVAEYADITLKKYNCRSCGFETRMRINFMGHILFHRYARRSKTYKCDICKHKVSSASSYSNHVRHYHKFYHLECGMCEFFTLQEHLLRKHILSHLKESKT